VVAGMKADGTPTHKEGPLTAFLNDQMGWDTYDRRGRAALQPNRPGNAVKKAAAKVLGCDAEYTTTCERVSLSGISEEHRMEECMRFATAKAGLFSGKLMGTPNFYRCAYGDTAWAAGANLRTRKKMKLSPEEGLEAHLVAHPGQCRSGQDGGFRQKHYGRKVRGPFNDSLRKPICKGDAEMVEAFNDGEAAKKAGFEEEGVPTYMSAMTWLMAQSETGDVRVTNEGYNAWKDARAEEKGFGAGGHVAREFAVQETGNPDVTMDEYMRFELAKSKGFVGPGGVEEQDKAWRQTMHSEITRDEYRRWRAWRLATPSERRFMRRPPEMPSETTDGFELDPADKLDLTPGGEELVDMNRGLA
jgi:hypothetical protein